MSKPYNGEQQFLEDQMHAAVLELAKVTTIPHAVSHAARGLRVILETEIGRLWPKEQTYVDWFVGRNYAGIKYLMPGLEVSQYESHKNQLDINYVQDLDLDALVDLCTHLTNYNAAK